MRTLALLGVATATALSLATLPSASAESTDACPPPADQVPVEEVPQGLDAVACGLVGITLTHAGTGAAVPPPGEGITLVRDTVGGLDNAVLDLTVAPDGTLTWSTESSGSPSTTIVPSEEVSLLLADSTSVPSAECTDTKRRYFGSGARWAVSPTFYIDLDTIPAELDSTKAVTSIRTAIQNVRNSNNVCGRPDKVYIGSGYGGDKDATSTVQQATVNGVPTVVCKSPDSTSLVNFGNLPAETLAYACGSYQVSSGKAYYYAGDIKVNKNDYTWTLAGGATTCSGLFDLTAVMAHEFGHFYGLAHISETKHPYLTMSPKIDPCDNSARTLGLGDMLGMEGYYG